MLVSPLYPNLFSSQGSEDGRQYQKMAANLEAFNSLLPPPVEFVEGSSSDALAVAEGKYEPINTTPKRITKAEGHEKSKPDSSSPSSPSTAKSSKLAQTTPTAPTNATVKIRPLYTGDIDLSWPPKVHLGSGLYNTGNTCFLNSSLQCLIHTPPLLHIISKHSPDKCLTKNSFCMACALRSVVVQSLTSNRSPFSPSAISGKLQVIAKHMRKGRQEDSHEFLRYAIDALQKSCLAGQPSKIDPKLAETTWVHKLFGGKLRSRVSCHSCSYNSDTFDSILDLSLDIHHSQNLKDALRKFVAPDHLKGADKYKCEKCKKHVNASKRFTIHDAPVVLTIHFKRFSPMGSKIGHMVSYDEQLSLDPYMSEGQFGPSYSLYGVICHAGGGPHSGHYYAYVKSKDNKWHEMNDESVSSASTPTRIKNSYILFYIKNKGQKLESAIKVNPLSTNGSSIPFTPPQLQKSGLASQMQRKKRPREDGGTEEAEKEDKGTKVDKPFIGPLLPSPQKHDSGESSPSQAKRAKLDVVDPQASAIKRKIESAKAATAKASMSSLAGYGSDDDDEDMGKVEEKDKPEETSSKAENKRFSSPPSQPRNTPVAATLKLSTIPAKSFYSTPAVKKRPLQNNIGSVNRRPSPMGKNNGYNPFQFGRKGKSKVKAL